MNKLFQVLAFCLMYLGLDAQTTEDEYRYAAGGFKKASEFGFGEKQGYSIQPYSGLVDSQYQRQWSSQYSINLLIRENSLEDSIAAVILSKGNYSYCIPHPLSSNELVNRSLADFPEFWNSYNEAILFQFIQTAVWGRFIEKKFAGKTILKAECEIANHYEYERPKEYAKHWGEFLYNNCDRKSTLNASSHYPLYTCNEDCTVMVKYIISDKGAVLSAEVVDDTFFKEYNGLVGTSTDSDCVRSYAESLVKEFTYQPSTSKESVGYMLIKLYSNKSSNYAY